MENAVLKLDVAKAFIAKQDNISDLLTFKDIADAVAKKNLRELKANGDETLEAQNEFAQIKIRIDRRMGEITRGMESGRGKSVQMNVQGEHSFKKEQIAEAGLTQPTVQRNEAIASLSDDEFEGYIEETKAKGGEVTKTGVLNVAKKKAKEELKVARKEASKEFSDKVIDGIYHADITDRASWRCIDAGSIDAIITDPPYVKDAIHVVSDLSAFAEYALRDGGDLFCLMGQTYLPDAMRMLSEKLEYYWTIAYALPGMGTRMRQKETFAYWMPIMWFTKGKRREGAKFLANDMIENPYKPKESHEWEKGLVGIERIVEACTSEYSVICDPFLGSGTTMVAVKNVGGGRKYCGFDVDIDAVNMTKKRLEVCDG